MFAYTHQQRQQQQVPASISQDLRHYTRDKFLIEIDRALTAWMETAGASSPAEAENGQAVESNNNNNNNKDLSDNNPDSQTDDNNTPAQPTQSIPSYAPPPYWSHVRNPSRLSQISQLSFDGRRPAPIILEDHTEESTEQSKASWARSAHIEDHVVITGSAPGIGDYVVWNCTIDTLNGASFTIRKRYSEFDKLRHDLVKAFPRASSSLPPLPPKSLIKRFKPKFLEKRREGLMYFLNCVVLNPEFSASPILRDFLLS